MVDSIPIPDLAPIQDHVDLAIHILDHMLSHESDLAVRKYWRLGAAIYVPEAAMTARAMGWDGMRTATVSSPPVVLSGTASPLLKIMVSGPGQKALASL